MFERKTVFVFILHFLELHVVKAGEVYRLDEIYIYIERSIRKRGRERGHPSLRLLMPWPCWRGSESESKTWQQICEGTDVGPYFFAI